MVVAMVEGMEVAMEVAMVAGTEVAMVAGAVATGAVSVCPCSCASSLPCLWFVIGNQQLPAVKCQRRRQHVTNCHEACMHACYKQRLPCSGC
jgi:hypothetical protein